MLCSQSWTKNPEQGRHMGPAPAAWPDPTSPLCLFQDKVRSDRDQAPPTTAPQTDQGACCSQPRRWRRRAAFPTLFRKTNPGLSALVPPVSHPQPLIFFFFSKLDVRIFSSVQKETHIHEESLPISSSLQSLTTTNLLSADLPLGDVSNK